jgi:hypothetical protein
MMSWVLSHLWIVTWTMIVGNFQIQMLNLALNDVYYATLAVGRGDVVTAHKLSRRARRLRRWTWPTRCAFPQSKRLFW